MAWAWGVEFLPRLGAAVILMALGFIARRLGGARRARRRPRTRHIDCDASSRSLATVARYAILILVLVAALGQLGVQTTSLLAVLGAAGLAIGLALQGTLQNIAAGIMLLYLRPFRVGDYDRDADRRRHGQGDRPLRHAPRDGRRALLLRAELGALERAAQEPHAQSAPDDHHPVQHQLHLRPGRGAPRHPRHGGRRTSAS